MPATRRLQKPAFSLVELLVVIGIIGILASLILVALNQGKRQAQQARCASNVRQFGVALCGFVAENHVYPLVAARRSDSRYAEHVAWLRQAGFSPGSTVFVCPAAGSLRLLPPPKEYIFYGYNHSGLSRPTETNSLGLGGQLVWPGQRVTAPPVRESEVASPTDMMAIGDGFAGGNGTVLDGLPHLWRVADTPDDPGRTRRSFARHRGKANVVFCDGHVEAPTLNFLFQDESDAALVRWNRDHLPHREKLKL